MNLLQECMGAKTIGISGHIRPDGDCVGACLSLCRFLKKGLSDTDVTVQVYLQKAPATFAEMPGFSEVIWDFPYVAKPFDVYFVLDCETSRTGNADKYINNAKKVINIDHHMTNAGCGHVNCVRPEVGSVCEVLYELMMETDPSLMDAEIAECIYIGMIHDTGIFQFSNTKPRTLEIAANLISYGFDFPRLIEETYYEKTYVQTQILGRALMESIRFMDGKCIVSAIDRKTMDFYNVTPGDLDGIVNRLRNIKGIECAIFMYQTGTLEYKVSLRTTPKVDAAAVASYFGGGGHKAAAGCTMEGTFYDCVNNLSLHIEEQLLKAEGIKEA